MPTLIFFKENETSLPFAIDDRIFLGEGLFETMRVFNSKVKYAKQHWQRLKKAAFFLGIAFELTFELWIEKLNHFIQLKKMQEGAIKALLSGGRAPRGLAQRAKESCLVFDAFQFIQSSKPLSLVSAPWRRDARNPIYQIKAVNYLEAIIARRHAQAEGAEDALFFNFQNQATETTVANFFIIKENQLLTPAINCGVLPGIIRQRLLILYKEQGLKCFERVIDQELINQAEAAFTSNSLQGIRAISSFDGHIFDSEHPLIRASQAMLFND